MSFDHKFYACSCRPNLGSPSFLKKHIDKVIETRFEHLERYAAAFIQEVGSEEASKYQLMEVHQGTTTTWYYKRMEDAEE